MSEPKCGDVFRQTLLVGVLTCTCVLHEGHAGKHMSGYIQGDDLKAWLTWENP